MANAFSYIVAHYKDILSALLALSECLGVLCALLVPKAKSFTGFIGSAILFLKKIGASEPVQPSK